MKRHLKDISMDMETLSRIQFALTSGFHYIYPPLSIGLGLLLVIIEGIYLKTKDPLYKKMTIFWIRIFAATFALGVATGIVQLFGFGTNWARYSRFVGDVFGSALGAEGIFAFFLEAGFLGVMLFGWNRVSPRMHYISTVLVALGAHFSAVWIVVANSWMQTPAGFKIVGEGDQAKAVVTDFWQMVFNPSSVDRLVHVVIGCWLAGIFLFLSVNAYYLLKKKHLEFARTSMKVGLWSALVVLILQLISADSTARGVAVNQPTKLAAMEGVYETVPYTPMTVLGWVDTEKESVKGIQVPGLLSFLTYHNFEQPVKGLHEFPKEDWPKVQAVFQTYHIMIFMWGFMLLTTLAGLFFWRKGTLVQATGKAKWALRGLVLSVLFPQIANQTGWMTAEMGRQPWIVWGLLRTSQGVSASVSAGQVMASISMLALIYIGLLCVFLFIIDSKIKHGPEEEEEKDILYRNPYEIGGK